MLVDLKYWNCKAILYECQSGMFFYPAEPFSHKSIIIFVECELNPSEKGWLPVQMLQMTFTELCSACE